MAKYTPGPWQVGNTVEGHRFNASNVYATATQSGIAQVYGVPLNTQLEDVDEKYGEGLANAHLIAAAPDLLAACELFLQYDGENCQTSQTHYDAVKLAITAAISKATPE